MNDFYCHDCNDEYFRFCHICLNKICYYCQELCECEKNIDRTSLYTTTNGVLKLCNVSCFNYFVKCNHCNKSFCH